MPIFERVGLSSANVLVITFFLTATSFSINGCSSYSFNSGTRNNVMRFSGHSRPVPVGEQFGPLSTSPFVRLSTPLFAADTGIHEDNNNGDDKRTSPPSIITSLKKSLHSTSVAIAFGLACLTSQIIFPATPATAASDSTAIVSCLLNKCALPLGKCIANPKCLANVVCINTCTGKPDEIGCQIKCGDLFENDVVGEFNKCAVSDMDCVPQQKDQGMYPALPTKPNQLVTSFNTEKFFTGRWYITAGQNELFDIFPCQVHFFTSTGPGKFFAKLNWRITEPDGEFFNRDAVQEFIQDPKEPSHLINHDNEYLHYQDDWWIIDYEYDDNKDNIPPFCFVYYRGSNDAWDGYGGAVVYTRDASLPESLLPRLRAAAEKVGFNYDKDFVATDNSCPAALSGKETVLLRENFAGKVALQTEKQLQAEATRLRGNAANSVKAQKIYLQQEQKAVENAIERLELKTKEFEKQTVKDAIKLEKQLVEGVPSS